jgi:hypothetical protein
MEKFVEVGKIVNTIEIPKEKDMVEFFFDNNEALLTEK